MSKTASSQSSKRGPLFKYLDLEGFVRRFGLSSLPLQEDQSLDKARVYLAMQDAEAMVESYLVSVQTPPDSALLVLCASDIAFYRLWDRVAASDEVASKYETAIALLERLSQSQSQTHQAAMVPIPRRRPSCFNQQGVV